METGKYKRIVVKMGHFKFECDLRACRSYHFLNLSSLPCFPRLKANPMPNPCSYEWNLFSDPGETVFFYEIRTFQMFDPHTGFKKRPGPHFYLCDKYW